MSNQGGWCWEGSPYIPEWEGGGPFWCHHASCRETERAAAALPDDWWKLDLPTPEQLERWEAHQAAKEAKVERASARMMAGLPALEEGETW